jgi:peptidoglycan hydrolase CwlO-like protein
MNQQAPPPNSVSPDEISAAFAQSFGAAIGQLTFEKLRLEKQVEALQAKIAQLEAAQVELERRNAQLTAGAITYEDRIAQLEEELAARPTVEQLAALEAQVDELIADGPTVAHSAARDLAKVAEGNQKAGPVGAD